MYVNIFGCDEYMNVYIPPEEETPHNSLYYCHNPKKHYYDAPIYFISFVVVSAFVMLSLFIGAITMSMSESMEELKRTQEEKKKQAQAEHEEKVRRDQSKERKRQEEEMKQIQQVQQRAEEKGRQAILSTTTALGISAAGRPLLGVMTWPAQPRRRPVGPGPRHHMAQT